MFQSLAGEEPGDQPLYAGLSASVRLGLAAPRIPGETFRMEPFAAGEPPPALAAVHAAAARARQALLDREHEFDIRRRYLRLAIEDYVKAVEPLTPKVGEALPAETPAYKQQMAALKNQLGRAQADIAALHGILLRQEQAKDVAERVRAVAKDMSGRPGAGDAKKLLDGLVETLDKNLAATAAMLKAGETLVAGYVEWLSTQRAAAEALEIEVAEGGAAPRDKTTSFFERKAWIESAPRESAPKPPPKR